MVKSKNIEEMLRKNEKKFSYNEILNILKKAHEDAEKNVRQSRDVIEFNDNYEYNIRKLAGDLYYRQYETKELRCFIIEDPVMREVFAPDFSDRIVSHFLYLLLIPIFERTFIDYSFSCRVGKGTHCGVEAAEKCLRKCSQNYTKDVYILQLDISGYFMSIDNQLLFNETKRIIDKYRYKENKYGIRYNEIIDFDLVYYLLNEIIFRHPLTKCKIVGNPKKWKLLPLNKSMFNSPDGVGLIIGDIMSQVFSNIFLGVFDSYMVHKKKMKYYGRYVDDSYTMSLSKEELEKLIPEIDQFLTEKLHLSINYKKTRIINARNGFTFLGFRINPFYRVPKKKTIKRMRARLYKMAHSLPSDYHDTNEKKVIDFMATMNSCLGHLRHCNSYNVRKEFFEKNPILSTYFIFDKNYEKVNVKKEVKQYFKQIRKEKEEKQIQHAQDNNQESKLP